MDVKLDKMENFYFALKVIFTVVVLGAILALVSSLGELGSMLTGAATMGIFLLYAGMLALFVLVQKIFLIGYLKGNGVQITEGQFPEVYAEYRTMAEAMGVRKLPRLFLLQEGGMLNAFAIRFSGSNYIAVYSEVFALVSSDMESLRFILAHELGHVRGHHMSKRFWTFPSSLVPFLTPAWSRRCEYGCDAYGAANARANPLNGLVLLAAGPQLYSRINVDRYIEDARGNRTGAVRFAGLFMSHPYLPLRLARIESLKGG